MTTWRDKTVPEMTTQDLAFYMYHVHNVDLATWKLAALHALIANSKDPDSVGEWFARFVIEEEAAYTKRDRADMGLDDFAADEGWEML